MLSVDKEQGAKCRVIIRIGDIKSHIHSQAGVESVVGIPIRNIEPERSAIVFYLPIIIGLRVTVYIHLCFAVEECIKPSVVVIILQIVVAIACRYESDEQSRLTQTGLCAPSIAVDPKLVSHDIVEVNLLILHESAGCVSRFLTHTIHNRGHSIEAHERQCHH